MVSAYKIPEKMFKPSEVMYPLDMDALEGWLKKQALHLDRSIPPRQFAGGVGNFNYLIKINGKLAVLRRPPPGPRPAGANDMEREFRVLSALNSHNRFVPAALALCEEENILGAPFMLSEYRSGHVIRGSKLNVAPELRRKIGALLPKLLAELHSVDIDQDSSLSNLGRGDDFAARTVKGWKKRALAATGDNINPNLNAVTQWLEENIPDSASRHTLLHNDFKLDNIIVEPSDYTQPVAILDWDQATIGEPLFDLATLLSYWVSPNDPPAMLALNQMPTLEEGFQSRKEIVDIYANESGIDMTNIVFYRVLAQFKLSVVVFQLYARWQRNPEKFPEMAQYDQVANGLVHFTHALIEERFF